MTYNVMMGTLNPTHSLTTTTATITTTSTTATTITYTTTTTTSSDKCFFLIFSCYRLLAVSSPWRHQVRLLHQQLKSLRRRFDRGVSYIQKRLRTLSAFANLMTRGKIDARTIGKAQITTIRFDCNSTALLAFDDLCYDRRPTRCGLLHSSSSGGTLEEHSRFHDASPGRMIRCSPQRIAAVALRPK